MKPEVLVEYRGEVLTLRQVSKKYNVHFSTVRYKATVGNKLEGHEIYFHKTPMKPEAKKIERPLRRKYRDEDGSFDNEGYERDIEEYCDQLTSERDELKEQRDKHSQLAINVQMELQTLLKALKILNKMSKAQDYKAKEFLEIYLGGNMFVKTLTPSAISDFGDAFARIKVNKTLEDVEDVLKLFWGEHHKDLPDLLNEIKTLKL